MVLKKSIVNIERVIGKIEVRNALVFIAWFSLKLEVVYKLVGGLDECKVSLKCIWWKMRKLFHDLKQQQQQKKQTVYSVAGGPDWKKI